MKDVISDADSQIIAPLTRELIYPAEELRNVFLEILIQEKEFTKAESSVKNWLSNIQKRIPTSFDDSPMSLRDFTNSLVEMIINYLFALWLCKDNKSTDSGVVSSTNDFLAGPLNSQFLKDIVSIISNPLISPYVNSFLQILSRVDLDKLKWNFDQEKPIISFYNRFLWEFTPETAKKRGVISTPYEIVDFMINGIDWVLRTHLGKEQGIFDRKVTYFDPASGTMTFPIRLLHFANKYLKASNSNQQAKYQRKLTAWFTEVFSRNLYALEVLPAPFVLSHFRIWFAATEFGIDIDSYYHMNLYLRNSLSPEPIESKKSITVIMGNPPYRRFTQNKSEWIRAMMQDYKRGLEERNIQPLSDDYVKFIRFAQWKVQQGDKGIVAYITNNTFLDGRIFRKMRKELYQVFDHIYIVNLYGNTRKGESGNPFNIKVGVCVVFFVCTENARSSPTTIHYWGITHPRRAEKLTELTHGFDLSRFKPLPVTGEYLFVPSRIKSGILDKYNKFHSLDQLFKYKSVGIATHRDKLVIDVNRESLQHRLKLFFQKQENELETMGIKILSTLDFDKNRVQTLGLLEQSVSKIGPFSFRGFDERFLSYEEELLDRPRRRLMDNITDDNPALIVTKLLLCPPFTHVFITTKPFHKCLLSAKSKESAYGFVLEVEKKSNVILPSLSYQITPKLMLNYIYGVLFSPTYRDRYSLALVRDFPRIPFPKTEAVLRGMAKLGKELISLHLLKSTDIISSQFPVSEPKNLRITHISYYPNQQRIYLQSLKKGEENGNFWVGNITQTMWDFEIGNHQVLKQWLYSRRYRRRNIEYKKNTISRALSTQELEHFLRVCSVISKTLSIIPKIDAIYRKIDPP